jgi:hypothetical protein
MHSIIAYRIAQNISIKDKASFILGGIAPDAVYPKDLSHFYAGDVQDYSRRIEPSKFLEKYSAHKYNPYILGYYTHLIADELWLNGFYLPWLKNRMESSKEILNLYHHDFRLLNGKLLDYYGLKKELLGLIESNGTIINLQEVTSKDVEDFKPYVIGDMNYNLTDLEEGLNVFTLDQIIGYIETSIQKGIFYIEHTK